MMDVLNNPAVIIILHIYMNQIITSYNLNVHNVISRLYLNKTGEN